MNPYKVLNIDQNAGDQEILNAVARAMRERKYSVKEIAEARMKLMDPVSKSVENFICVMDITPFLKGRDVEPVRRPAVTLSDLNYIGRPEQG